MLKINGFDLGTNRTPIGNSKRQFTIFYMFDLPLANELKPRNCVVEESPTTTDINFEVSELRRRKPTGHQLNNNKN